MVPDASGAKRATRTNPGTITAAGSGSAAAMSDISNGDVNRPIRSSVSFKGVRVANINEEGVTAPKFAREVFLVAEYDPEVRLVFFSP